MRTILVQLFMVAAYIACTIAVMIGARWFVHLFEWWIVAIAVISFCGFAVGWLTRDKRAQVEIASARRDAITVLYPGESDRQGSPAGWEQEFRRSLTDVGKPGNRAARG